MRDGKFRILVVDDDESVREMLSFILSSYGDVEVAADGKEARQKFETVEYDIVMLDYLLPDTDGVELLKHFSSLNSRAEFIMITHVKDVKVAVQAIKLGAFDYINKDFDLDDLKALINRVIEKIKNKKSSKLI